MHKLVDRLLELRKFTLSDVSTPVDGPTECTRAATQQVAAMGQSTTTASNSNEANLESSLSSDPQGRLVIEETITSDDLASPVVPRRFEQLSQPPKS